MITHNRVNSLDEAMKFFLRNSSDSVVCYKDGKEKECSSYPEAEKFYKED